MSKNRFLVALGLLLTMAACLAWAGTTANAAAKDDSNAKVAFDACGGLQGCVEIRPLRGLPTHSEAPAVEERISG